MLSDEQCVEIMEHMLKSYKDNGSGVKWMLSDMGESNWACMMQYIVVNVALFKKIDSSRGSTALHCTPISILHHGTFSTFVLHIVPLPMLHWSQLQTHCHCTSMSLVVAPSFHLVTQLNFKLCLSFSFFRYCLISNSFHQCILQVMLVNPQTKPIPSNIIPRTATPNARIYDAALYFV